MTTRTRWRLVWVSWSAAFAIAETVALRSKHPDAPLCAHLRPILGCRAGKAHRTLGASAVCVFAVWFADHLYRER